MTKILRSLRWVFCLAVMLPALALTGCKDDDDEEQNNASNHDPALVGKWQYDGNSSRSIVFGADGSWQEIEPGYVDYGTWWTAPGNKCYIRFNDGGEVEVNTYRIEGNKLHIIEGDINPGSGAYDGMWDHYTKVG